MDIESAFTQEAIAAADVDIVGDEEAAVREVVQKIFATNELMLGEEETQRVFENVAILCFVAGRAYQQSDAQVQIPVTMSPELVSQFLEFLSQREGT